MNLPAALFALAALSRETFAQARAAGITWGLFSITAVCTLFCLGVSVRGDTPPLETRHYEHQYSIPASEADKLPLNRDQVRGDGVDVPTGEMTLFFGAVRVPINRTGSRSVRLIQVILAGGVADTAGILLALLWTASFLPTFLDQASASVMLAKPIPRWCLLLGKYLGIVATVAAQAFLFVAATWAALGLRTGAWDLRYFLALPVLLLHFAVFFSISVLLAVWYRSAVACALGTLGVWVLCFTVNLARHDAVLRGDGAARKCSALEIGYWLLPKPADYNLLLADALNADEYFSRAIDVRALEARGAYMPDVTLFSGMVTTLAALTLAGCKWNRMDY